MIQSPPQYIEPQKPARSSVVDRGAPESAEYGYTKGKVSSELLFFETIFSAVFAGLLTVITFQYVIRGTLSTPVAVSLFVIGFVIFFAVIHYGKLLRK